MKKISIITCILLLITSCGTDKNVTSATTTTTTETNVDNENDTDPSKTKNGDVLITDGVIRDKSADGCGFLIQMMVDANTETTTFYEPLKLPKEYQEDGKLIRIEYRMSRRPSNCAIAIPIVIDQVLSK